MLLEGEAVAYGYRDRHGCKQGDLAKGRRRALGRFALDEFHYLASPFPGLETALEEGQHVGEPGRSLAVHGELSRCEKREGPAVGCQGADPLRAACIDERSEFHWRSP